MSGDDPAMDLLTIGGVPFFPRRSPRQVWRLSCREQFSRLLIVDKLPLNPDVLPLDFEIEQ